MQTRHVLMFVAVAVLFGAIISMITSGVFVSAQTKSSNTNTPATGDSDFVKQGLRDSDEQGSGDTTGVDDTAGEQEDSSVCVEADSAGDAGGADDDVNEEENATTSTGNNATNAEEEDSSQAAFEPCNFSSNIDNPYMPFSMHIGKTLELIS